MIRKFFLFLMVAFAGGALSALVLRSAESSRQDHTASTMAIVVCSVSFAALAGINGFAMVMGRYLGPDLHVTFMKQLCQFAGNSTLAIGGSCLVLWLIYGDADLLFTARASFVVFLGLAATVGIGVAADTHRIVKTQRRED